MAEALVAAFLEAATWHGPLEPADAILAAHPGVRTASIHTAAVLGDEAGVRGFLAQDPSSVRATAPPFGGDALNYLCLSKYLRLDRSRTAGFLRAATALLDAGADPNTGFWTEGPPPERETALYGAAGVAHHAPLTRLLLERGADPNDEEAVYHSPETYDSEAMKLLVETREVTPENLVIMLVRKLDWHDHEGAGYLLDHGADPNGARARGWHPLHHALARDSAPETVALLLDHGADPALLSGGRSAVALAARAGRSDVLELLEQRGVPTDLQGVDRLVAACARGDPAAVSRLALAEPATTRELVAMGGTLLARFAGVGNAAGVRALLDLGVDVRAPWPEGDGYWGVPARSQAIHVAAWRARHAVVKLLLERGAPPSAPDANGRMPLALAVRACVDSYWTERRAPDSVRLLLEAGASPRGVSLPTGYDEIDDLLRERRA